MNHLQTTRWYSCTSTIESNTEYYLLTMRVRLRNIKNFMSPGLNEMGIFDWNVLHSGNGQIISRHFQLWLLCNLPIPQITPQCQVLLYCSFIWSELYFHTVSNLKDWETPDLNFQLDITMTMLNPSFTREIRSCGSSWKWRYGYYWEKERKLSTTTTTFDINCFWYDDFCVRLPDCVNVC
jgi:hypothetical protein